MDVLIITDLHLTEIPGESYRWEVFDFVKTELDSHKYDYLFILGDLFEKKDKHKAELVNALVSMLVGISNEYCPIIILQGNHDYVVKQNEGFLRFLGKYDKITYINVPTKMFDNMLFLPHSRTPENDWEDLLPEINSKSLKFIFMHQSVIGVKVSNYHEMKESLDPSFFKNASAKIVSGDIHLPQELSGILYIGTQHPVSFGDHYQPRMMTIKNDKIRFIELDTIHREHIKMPIVVITDLLTVLEDLIPKDQVKITLQLNKNQMHEWASFKKRITSFCKDHELELHDLRMEKLEEATASDDMVEFLRTNMKSLSSEDVLMKFAQTEKIDEDLLNIGLAIFKGE